MKENFALVSTFLAVFVGTVSNCGCSIIGLCIGAATDPGQLGAPVSVQDSILALPPKTELFILKKDSVMVEGTFVGIGQIPRTISAADYATEFENWRLQCAQAESLCIPPYGTMVQVRVDVFGRQECYTGSFAGLDSGMVRILSAPERRVLPLRLEFVQKLCDSINRPITQGEALRQAAKMDVPLSCRQEYLRGIIFEGTPPKGVPFDEIQRVYLWEPSDAALRGFLKGLAVDVVSVLAAGLMAYGIGSNMMH